MIVVLMLAILVGYAEPCCYFTKTYYKDNLCATSIDGYKAVEWNTKNNETTPCLPAGELLKDQWIIITGCDYEKVEWSHFKDEKCSSTSKG